MLLCLGSVGSIVLVSVCRVVCWIGVSGVGVSGVGVEELGIVIGIFWLFGEVV